MKDLTLMAAAGGLKVDPTPPVKITPQHKAEWNKFLNFINDKGYRGNKDLDKRDTNIGRSLMEEYRKVNPQTIINYDLVKPIQEGVLADWEIANKIKSLQGVKADNVDNRPLSQPDGWLGSLTSNGYFPAAKTYDSKGNVIKDWGYDMDAYYQNLLNEQVSKVPMNSYTKNK